MSFRSSKRYTAVRATELILANSVNDSEPLSDYHEDEDYLSEDQLSLDSMVTYLLLLKKFVLLLVFNLFLVLTKWDLNL